MNSLFNSNFIDKNKYVDTVYKNEKRIYSKKSKYQTIEVYKNKMFGNILVIDNDLQLTQLDEANYHEMISHIPLNYLDSAKNVLLIGGGDGGTARDVLKHKNIKHLDQIEIDIEVVNTCKKYFKKLSSSYKDSRLNLIIEDGSVWVKNNLKKKKNFYDLILVDSTDYTTAISLFTYEFYENLKKILKKKGIMVFNNMSVAWKIKYFKETVNSLSELFKYAKPYQVFQPSYSSGHYSFMFCSDYIDPTNHPINWQLWKKKKIKCKYYNSDIHQMSFALPNFALSKISKKKRLGTHYLIDVSGIRSKNINIVQKMINMGNLICRIYDLNIIDILKHEFKPQGLTIIFLLSESHLSIHTWPEKKALCLDLFSCSDFKYNVKINNINVNIKSVIKSFLQPHSIKMKSIEREV